MNIITALLLAFGLAMDSFAVSITSGVKEKNIITKSEIFLMAVFLGFFQGFMPFIGWVLGTGLESIVKSYDHWIAFILLTMIGIKMIYESVKNKNTKEIEFHSLKTLLLLSIATSADALIAGITFAFINIQLLLSLIIIGSITFILSLIGPCIGKRLGEKFGTKSEIAGGFILIFIGSKILITHIFNL